MHTPSAALALYLSTSYSYSVSETSTQDLNFKWNSHLEKQQPHGDRAVFGRITTHRSGRK